MNPLIRSVMEIFIYFDLLLWYP